MAKNVRLANIYIKIYNKSTLTMDDLAFLAKYDPECFEKTCKNLVYNAPETKTLMKAKSEEAKNAKPREMEKALPCVAKPVIELVADQPIAEEKPSEIEALLGNLKQLEGEEANLQKLDLDSVKHLLGSLFMEMLFPHNDREKSFEMGEDEFYSTFNKKI